LRALLVVDDELLGMSVDCSGYHCKRDRRL